MQYTIFLWTAVATGVITTAVLALLQQQQY
jgi:hypothetical protein